MTATAGVSYAHTDIDRYAENNGGVGNQFVKNQRYDYFAPVVGLRVTGTTTGQKDWCGDSQPSDSIS